MTQKPLKRETYNSSHVLQGTLELPCGAILKNRLAKSPMSDSLGNGEGDPTEAQIRLYEKWAEGGVARLSLSDSNFVFVCCRMSCKQVNR